MRSGDDVKWKLLAQTHFCIEPISVEMPAGMWKGPLTLSPEERVWLKVNDVVVGRGTVTLVGEGKKGEKMRKTKKKTHSFKNSVARTTKVLLAVHSHELVE